MADLGAWLDSLGLRKYLALFAENDVDIEVLPALSDDELRELGLPIGARKKILQAARELRAQRTSVPPSPREPSPAISERRQITVMFSDIVGSTALAERMDVEDLRAVLLAYQQASAEAVERHGGHVAQYLGDGVMAYFGYPRALEDGAAGAVLAALAIVNRIRQVNERLVSQYGVLLAIRVGLHTGLVVAGDLGAGRTREHLAIGETPNVGARIQGLADPSTVVVSEATWRLVEGFFVAVPLGAQSLRGVGEPVALYRIVGPSGVTNRFEARAAARPLTPLVSRDIELSLLQKRWELAQDSEGQAVLVQGEAGIGKSRLVQAFRDALRSTEHETVTLSCSSHHQASAFHPVADYLGRVLGLESGDATEAREERLHGLLTRLRLTPERHLAPLALLLGISTDARLPSDANQVRRLILDALLELVLSLATDRPLLFVTEDLHWIDPSTQEHLTQVVDAIGDRPVLILMTARPDYRGPWNGLAHFGAVSLSRLSRREAETMIRKVAGDRIAPDLVSKLLSRTDGVPLFIEELTKAVLEAGGQSSGLETVPTTLQEALTARLDRLEPFREVIQVAALLGRSFDAEVVQVATGLGSDHLQRALTALVDAGLTYRRAPGPMAFEFKHALVQEAALSTLVRQRRRHLHGRITAALDRVRPEISERQPEILAHHVQEAGDDRRACDLWRAAGELATKRSATREAVNHFTQAAECLKRLAPPAVFPAEEAEVYLLLSRALMRADGYLSDRLARAADAARRSAEAAGSVHLIGQVLLESAPIFCSSGRNGKLLAAVEGLSFESDHKDSPWLQASLLVTRGIARFNRGELMDAQQVFDSAMAILSDLPPNGRVRLGEGDLRVVVRSYAVRCLARLGRLEQALRTGIEAERIGRSLADDRFSLAWAIFVRSTGYYHVGDHQATFADAEEVIAICQEHGFSARLGNGLMRRGFARARLGDVPTGIQEFRRGRAMWRDLGVVHHSAEHATELCDLLVEAAELSEAEALLDDVDELVGGTDEAACLAECQRIRGMIAAREGDALSAIRWFESAIATARGQSALLFELRAATYLAELLAAHGRGVEGAHRLSDVYARFTEGHRAPDLVAAKTLLQRLAA